MSSHVDDRDDKREWRLDLEDNEWPLTTIDHDRMIARAIVVDDEGYFYFVRANRDADALVLEGLLRVGKNRF